MRQQLLHVLIIDDSSADVALVVHALKRGGYDLSYDVADTPHTMRAILERTKCDLIISDHSMPQFNASSALELAMEICPDVPFIIVSGAIDLQLAVSLMKAGANNYIQKHELERLVPAVQRALLEVDNFRERKRMENALHASEMRYRRLFETAKDGILILDTDSGAIVDVNPCILEMLGCDRSDMAGRKIWETEIFGDRELCRSTFYELQQKGYVRYEDVPLKKMDGEEVDVDYVSNVYQIEDKKFIQYNIREITARKKAEAQVRVLDAFLQKRAQELEAANHELETFNYTVSHDLRAPLTNISGYCQVIQETYSAKMDTPCLMYFQEILNAVQRMKELIDTLLEFSRLAYCSVHPVQFDLVETAMIVDTELRLLYPHRQVTFSAPEKMMVTGDQKLLRIVIENLLTNSWKYTDTTADAGIELGCFVSVDTPVCFVRDNGIGFDMAQASKLFTPFLRLENSGEREGSGIGLATVKRIIERHGGKVWAEGEMGKGATVFFTI